MSDDLRISSRRSQRAAGGADSREEPPYVPAIVLDPNEVYNNG